MLSLLSAIYFDDFTAWYSVLLSVRQMTGVAIVEKISMIIHLIQYAFLDASISDIASAASVLFTNLFILFGCQAMGFMLFPNAFSLYPPNISSLWTTTWHVCKVDCLPSSTSWLFLHFLPY